LPSTRRLALELGVSRGLAQECYEQLVAGGFLVARAGAGTRVAERAARSPARPARPRSRPPVSVDFRAGVPDVASVPTRDWLWALSDAARTAPLDVFGCGHPAGRPELRTVLAAYLRRVRGADVDADSIVVCNGFTQGLRLVLTMLHAAGRTHARARASDRIRALRPPPAADARPLRGQAGPPQLVLGFANLSEPAIRRGIAAIADLIRNREATSRSPQ
jgi:GntR family transcriptional regulator/MocR family aminotransferase